jgi:hypothetical protein
MVPPERSQKMNALNANDKGQGDWNRQQPHKCATRQFEERTKENKSEYERIFQKCSQIRPSSPFSETRAKKRPRDLSVPRAPDQELRINGDKLQK